MTAKIDTRKPYVPRNNCPPSKRGHSWRELTLADLPKGSVAVFRIAADLRICKRCNTLGRVNKQGLIDIVAVV